LPFLLDVAFALSVRFLSFQQYILMTSVPNVVPIYPFLLPALLADISFLPLPKYLSLYQHISYTSLPISCLYIHHPCLLCFPLLPFLPDVAFALSVRFLSFQQYISITSVPNVVLIHPFLLPALLPDIAFASSA